jgi:hypothetical protein
MSNMTLHHVKELKSLFHQFQNIILPGGYLCIADLDLDDGMFHVDNTGVFHSGFDRAEMREVFRDTGFENIQDITAAEMRRFTIFLMTGQKR